MIRFRSVYKLFFVVLLCSACGLETFYRMEPPRDAVPQNAADGVVHLPPVSTDESRKFEFTSVQNASFIASGTEIYYRIYNSITELQQDAKAINAVNADLKVDGFYKLQSLNYRRLRIEKNSKKQELLIEGNHRVVLRLTDDGGFSAGLLYDGVPAAGFSLPLRSTDAPFYFDAAASEHLKNPQTGDADFKNSGSPDTFWYVNAYAVSVGLLSSTWTRSVSAVLPLGFLTFEKH